MCFGVSKPKIPKPAPPPPPAPVLEQDAPEMTSEARKKSNSRRTGTKRYRTGGNLNIQSNTSAKTGGLRIAGGS